MTDNKVTVFYHHPCIDGSVAAWSMHKKFGDTANYIGLDHADFHTIETTILDNVDKNTTAIFVDFAPRKEIIETVLNHVARIEVYDHHVTAQKDLADFMDHEKCHIVFDMNRSGAGIAYDVCIGGDRPLFVMLVENLDLYKPDRFANDDQFYEVASFLGSFDPERPLDQVLSDIDQLMEIKDMQTFEDMGRAPRENYLHEINEILEKIDMIDLSFLKHAPKSTTVPAVNVNLHNLGHEFSPKLIASCPMEQKLGLTWTHHNEDTIKVSFRSDNVIDVSLIAEELGNDYGLNGGGHKGAASVRFTIDQFKTFAEKSGLKFSA